MVPYTYYRLCESYREADGKVKQRNPEGLSENAGVAKEGAEVAKTARKEVEKRLGRSVVSPEKAIDHIQSPEELPFPKPEEQ